MRTTVLTVVGLTVLGLISLLLGPAACLATAALLVVGGFVQRRRAETRDLHLLATAAMGTGVALVACAVLLLLLAEHDQDAPVRLGPGSGFEVSTTTASTAGPVTGRP